MPAHDIALEVGSFAADDHSFFVQVTDGTLDVRLIRRAGFDRPIVNALRVTSRPNPQRSIMPRVSHIRPSPARGEAPLSSLPQGC